MVETFTLCNFTAGRHGKHFHQENQIGALGHCVTSLFLATQFIPYHESPVTQQAVYHSNRKEIDTADTAPKKPAIQ